MRRLRTLLFLAVTAVLISISLKPATAEAGPGYILCSCHLCSQEDVDCQISPSGFTISCADYYRIFCS
jgi:hypothetical protein